MKKPAAFMDHSFHQITRSNLFLKKWLGERYALEEYYDQSWQGGEQPDIERLVNGDYEVIFYFQFIHSFQKLKKIKGKKIVWFPMEGIFSGRRSRLFLWRLTGIPLKVVSFSRFTYERLRRYGFDCFYFPYFFDPASLPQKVSYHKPPKVFFWQRTREIDWPLVKRLIGKNRVAEVLLRLVPDPGQVLFPPSAEDVAAYHIRLEKEFISAEEYLRKVADYDIFFAPRSQEGIGMSFLEAAAMGLCVVAPDRPTMNEYFRSGENGLLYDLNNPQEVDLTDYEKMGRKAKKEAAAGYLLMEQRRLKLLEFINQKEKNSGLWRRLKGAFFAVAFSLLSE